MGKYRITATFDLVAIFEPDGYAEIDLGDNRLTDFEDTSPSWNSDRARAEGGEVRFTLEAESESNARAIANDVLGAGLMFSDSDWEIEDYSISEIEEIEEPMTTARARELLVAYLDKGYPRDPDTRAALEFAIENLPSWVTAP